MTGHSGRPVAVRASARLDVAPEVTDSARRATLSVGPSRWHVDPDRRRADQNRSGAGLLQQVALEMPAATVAPPLRNSGRRL